jgi:hypothetical protein
VQIKHIVLGTDGSLVGKAFVKKYRFNAMHQTYELYRNIYTTDAVIKQRILEALEEGSVYLFYKYELFNSAGELEGTLYSVNASLFD